MMSLLDKFKGEVASLQGIERRKARPIPKLLSAVDSGFVSLEVGNVEVMVVRHVGVGYKEGKLKVLYETKGVEEVMLEGTPIDRTRQKEEATIGKEVEIALTLPKPVAVDGSLLRVRQLGRPTEGLIGVAKDSSLRLLGKSFPDSLLLDKILREGEWVGFEKDGIGIAYLKTGGHVLTVTAHNIEEAVGIIYYNASLIKGFGYPPALAYAHLKAKIREESSLLATYQTLFAKNRDRLPFR